ncbi:hypothetical protein V500_06331 [Pseudogymnoascus sp. VKM F-4518 (FW-2643)]|nr:hypothetical protein V500_06331 [Pseudogymnoascus sp. VKM F-4518 (FW-2643)]
MPRGKRQNAEGGGQPNKRQKCDQASATTPKTDSVPQKKATRSTKTNSDSGTEIMRPSPLPELQLRQIPPPTKPNGFPCFSDGDVLVILDHDNQNYQYRLHSHILRTFSAVFDELLSAKLPEDLSKKILDTNKTELEFCLVLNRDPESGWCLQIESLFRNVTLDNSKAIPATGRQMKNDGRRFGSDGSSEDTPIPPTEGRSSLSPSRRNGIYFDGKDAVGGSNRDIFSGPLGTPKKSILAEHLGSSPAQDLNADMSFALGASRDSVKIEGSGCPQAKEDDEISVFGRTVDNATVEAFHGNCGSTLANDNQMKGSIQQDVKVFNSMTLVKAAATDITVEPSSITGANILGNGAPPTPTFESETSLVEMRQFTNPEQISGDISAVMDGLPKEYACDSITSSQTVALDNKTPSAPTSDWESSLATATAEIKEKTLDDSKTRTPVDTSDTGTLRRGVVETSIPILNFQRVNPAIRAGENGEKTCSARVSIDHVFVKGSQDDDCQLISVNQKSQSPPAPRVGPISKSRLIQLRKINAIASLLRVAYYKPPIVSQKDISLALIHSEHLIKAAKLYHTLPAVRSHVSHLLAQHGHSLFHSIALEPVRWLNLSINLEDKIIFQEAMIHLVGGIPDEFTSEPFSGVPDDVVKLVKRKYKEMDDEVSRVSRLLSVLSIYELGIRAGLTDKSSFDIWVLASFWREWFTTNLEAAQTRSRHPEEPTIQAKLGLLYRTIYAGGDAYLPNQEVLDVFRPLLQDGAYQTGGFLQWDTAPFDLTLMKTYASKTVQNLCYNRSQLDPSESGFTYLTCTHIGNHEFPWVSAPRK